MVPVHLVISYFGNNAVRSKIHILHRVPANLPHSMPAFDMPRPGAREAIRSSKSLSSGVTGYDTRVSVWLHLPLPP